MPRGFVPSLLLLAALWGSIYLLVELGVRDLEPMTIIAIRSLLAAVLLFAVLAHDRGARRSLSELRITWREGIVLGAVNTIGPTVLIAYGQKHVDSGTAAIANSTVPLFVVLLVLRFRPSESVPRSRLVGVAVGMLGVVVLAGARPPGGIWGVAGTLFVVGGSLCAAGASIFIASRSTSYDALLLLTTSTVWGGLLAAPAGFLQMPAHVGWEGLAASVGLALTSSVAGMLVFFKMIARYGSTRTSVIGYLLPAVGLVIGIGVLGEDVTVAKLAGFALILAGVALGSRAARTAAAPAPAD